MTVGRTVGGDGLELSFAAYGDLSSLQYRFVKISSAYQVTSLSSIADEPVGVLQTKPSAAGRQARVKVSGTMRVLAGAAITAANYVRTNASGYAIVASPQDGGIVGQALTTAASGQAVHILWDKGRFHPWTPGLSANAALTPAGLALVVGSDNLLTEGSGTTDAVGAVLRDAASSGETCAVYVPGDYCGMMAGAGGLVPGTAKITTGGFFIQTATGDYAHANIFTTATSGGVAFGIFRGSGTDQTD